MLSACAKLPEGDSKVSEAVKVYENGDYSTALSMLKEAETMELEVIKAETVYYYMGECYFKTGDIESSLAAHSKAVGINPELFKSWVTIGVCYRKLGDTEKALEAYSKALKYDPENGDSVGLYVSLGSLYISNGKPFTAIDYLENATEIYPEHAAAHAYLSMAYAMIYENERSEEELALAEALGYSQGDEIRERIKSIR